METVFRAAAIYAAILVLTRLAGRRTLSQATVFDFVLILLIAETAQNALVGSDNSLTNAVVLAATLILLDVGLSILKRRARWVAWWVDGTPTVLVRDGVPDAHAMAMSRIDEADILQAARQSQGIAELHEVRLAVLETCGAISIVPRRDGQEHRPGR